MTRYCLPDPPPELRERILDAACAAAEARPRRTWGMLSVAAALLVCCGVVAVVVVGPRQASTPAGPQDRVAKLIEQLDSEDPGERDRASADLIKIGKPALEQLQAMKEFGSAEQKERVEGVIRTIAAAVRLDNIEFQLAGSDRWFAGGRSFINFTVVNRNDAQVIISRELSIVIAPVGEPDRPCAIGGEFSDSFRPDCILVRQTQAFVALPANSRTEVSPSDEREGMDYFFWTPPKAGKYAVSVKYRYSRREFASRCPGTDKNCRHDDPAQPWNLALEGERTLQIEVVVPADSFPALIERLDSDSPDERDRASAELMKWGQVALDRLEAIKDFKSPEQKARAQSIIRTLRLNGMSFQLVWKEAPRVGGNPEIFIVISNRFGEEMVLSRAMTVTIVPVDELEKPCDIKYEHLDGFRCCVLGFDAGRFVAVPANSRMEAAITGLRKGDYWWEPQKAGKYKISIGYAFSRKDFVGRCRGGFKDCRHDDPAQPWNRAIEGKRTVIETEVEVKE